MKVHVPLTKKNFETISHYGIHFCNRQCYSKKKKKTTVRGFLGTRKRMTLVISYEDLSSHMTIIKSLKNSGVLTNGISEIVKHEITKQESRFLSILSGTLGTSILGNMLTRKGVVRAGRRYNINKNF